MAAAGLGAAPPDVDPARAQSLLAAGALLVDVRRPEEWHAGHIPQARHLPLDDLHLRAGELPRAVTLVVVCRSGRRSGLAAQLLRGAGFDAVNLGGGMLAWQAAGLPVVGPGGRPGRVA